MLRTVKLIRIRPFHYDWKYKPEEWQPWKLEAHGKVFTPPMKSMIPPHGLAYKKRIFPQPDSVSAKAGGLGPQRREKSAESRYQ